VSLGGGTRNRQRKGKLHHSERRNLYTRTNRKYRDPFDANCGGVLVHCRISQLAGANVDHTAGLTEAQMRDDAVTLDGITVRITRLAVRVSGAAGESIFAKQEEAEACQTMTTRMSAAPQHEGPSPITKALPPPGSTIAAYRFGGGKN
jgi:hypothetical protein